MPAAVSQPSPNHHHGTPPSPHGSTNSLSSTHSIRHTLTHLTYSRHHLIETAMETIKIAENGQYTNSKGVIVHLKDDLEYAVDNCVHYEHAFDFRAALKIYDDEERGLCNLNENDKGSTGDLGSLHSSRTLKLSFKGNNGTQRFLRTSFLVVSASWLEAASELLGASFSNGRKSSVGVLNSGSATTPGGRFLKGTVSQEDCLCRASLLYSCISQPKFQSEGRFYGKNRTFRYGTSNCVIFSPDVPVIRKDEVEGKLLDTYEKVSFVTVPAPNAFTTSSNTGKEYNDVKLDSSRRVSAIEFPPIDENSSTYFDDKLEQKRRALLASLSDRIHRALSAFVLGGCTDLVLPAFGCGVHGNDPTMVASVFREMLTDQNQFGGRFRTVVFAVPPCRKQNYQAFAAYFQQKQVVKRGATMA